MTDKQQPAKAPEQLLAEFLEAHELNLAVVAVGKTGSPHQILDFLPDGFQLQIRPVKRENGNAPA